MKVELLQHGDMDVVIRAIRKCYDSLGNSDSKHFLQPDGDYKLEVGCKDCKLIKEVIKSGHTSTLEHMSYTFEIDGISRGCLQELARHRISSFSVQSTRYCLKKLLKSDRPETDFLVLTGTAAVDLASFKSLISLKRIFQRFQNDVPNDILKYCLPESFMTSLIWTVNARSLRNFMELRLAPKAHWEIRKLANTIVAHIPEEHLVLFEDLLV